MPLFGTGRGNFWEVGAEWFPLPPKIAAHWETANVT